MSLFEKTEQALDGKKTIKIAGEDVDILPLTGDIISYLKTAQILRNSGKQGELIDFQFNFIVKLLKQANPSIPDKIIKVTVEQNFLQFIIETMVALNIAKREEIEEAESVPKN